MSRFLILLRKEVDGVIKCSDISNPEHGEWCDPNAVWLWDDETPKYRIFLSGGCPAYVPSNLVSSHKESWGPEENEIAFKESTT